MTTIATDGKSMAGDGRTHLRGTITNDEAVKVERLRDGRLFGACGSVQDSTQVRNWLNDGGDKPQVDDDFGALLLSTDGSIHWLSRKLEPEPASAPAAMGSGMDFALGAMLAGREPAFAVNIAAKRDVYTGGTITVLHLGEPQ